jgi:hypothetical protein
MSSCKFGDSFPLESIKSIIEILRAGDAVSKKWLLLQEASCAIGTAAKLMDERSPLPDNVMGSDEQQVIAAEKLQEIVDQQEDEQLMAGVPWFMIIKILLPIVIDSLGEEAPDRG